MRAWQVYVEALGAGDLLEQEQEITSLSTPEPKSEGERNRRRQDSVTKLRAHVRALRAEIYPYDEGEPPDG